MAKKHKQHRRKNDSLMGRSDIPYAQRLAMTHRGNIVNNRDHASKIAMYCYSVAMHEIEGIGYKRIVRYSYRFKEIVDEFYKDGADVGMDKAKRRLEQMGLPISGEFYSVKIDGATRKEQEVQDNRLQAAQVAIICGAIAMNDEFGFGHDRQKRIAIRANELSSQYAKEGDKFLLDKMEEIGFVIADGKAMAFTDEEGKPITSRQWEEKTGRNAKDGHLL